MTARTGLLSASWSTAGTPSRNGVVLMFQRVIGVPQPAVDQQMLRLTSTLSDPDQAAEDMAQQLLSTHPDDWVDSFGQSPED